MGKQTTSSIVMIEPVSFRYNEQTAVNNYFQQEPTIDSDIIQERAWREFNDMVERIRSAGIDVVVIKDRIDQPTPDSIFPNNWISFHEGGTVVLYPMYAVNRRHERRTDILSVLNSSGYYFANTLDYTHYEQKEFFLEGTGSMVFDRRNKIAYAAISERTHPELLRIFCKEMGFTPVSFTATQQVSNQRLAVYHTNVVMCLAEEYAVICLDSIDDQQEQNQVINTLTVTGKTIINISEEQMHHFAGNMLQLQDKKGARKLVLSQSAYTSLSNQQKSQLSAYNELIICPVETIEKYGGGSVRCMIAEIF